MGGKAVHPPYESRTRAVRAVEARATEVRNARETRLWWDAQVPDRDPRHRGKAA